MTRRKKPMQIVNEFWEWTALLFTLSLIGLALKEVIL